MTVLDRISALRQAMEKEKIAAYLVVSSDPHMSEIPAAHYAARAWISGFTGSAGTFVLTKEKAALWTDGRYFIQAERELAGTDILLMRMREPQTPEIEDWLAQELGQGDAVGLDGMVVPVQFTQRLEQVGVAIRDIDLITDIWTENRPALPCTPIWEMEVQYAGKTTSEKLELLRAELKKENANATFLSRLSSVAWLMNIRASDIPHSPFALAYCYVTPKQVILFVNTAQLPQAVAENLQQQGIEVREYQDVVQEIQAITDQMVVSYHPAEISYRLYQTLSDNPNVELKNGQEQVVRLKAVKNEVEIENIKQAHVKDGVVMVRFAMWLENQLATHQKITECDVSQWLLAARSVQKDYLDTSFETIAAYGANAAMMHYSPTPAACSVIEPKGFLLVDSGGQYRDGTTDITRTFAVGPLTQEEKQFYTLVLKSHVNMAKVVFKAGMPGRELDIIARETLWREGLDYRCGTGHGIGFVGDVHEGPQNLSSRGTAPFEVGMLITNEPGIYEEGKLGIRIENELLCKEYKKTEYGTFYCFEPITYCPIDTSGVLAEMLTQEEKNWLNAYHAMVQKTLQPYLTVQENEWLAKACQPV